VVTAIGRCFPPREPRARWACLTGVAAVAGDLTLVGCSPGYGDGQARAVLALVALVAQLYLARGDLPSVGLTPRPAQGWRYWAALALALGVAAAAVLGAAFGLWKLLGREVPLYLTPPDRLAGAAVRMCLLAPVVEEALYRLVLCVAVAPALGAWGAVLLSGALFATLHWLYGNPSPENQVGGFLLAWAFLRGGTVLLPVGLHALGNLCALASQLAGWYWLTHALA
jgi:uncharacterized protein